jgi:hypothetical protein
MRKNLNRFYTTPRRQVNESRCLFGQGGTVCTTHRSLSLPVVTTVAGTAMIRTGAISRMLGLASLVLGALNVAAAGSLSQDGLFSVHEGLGFLAFALLYIWVLVASIVMLVRPATRAVARRGE